MSVVLFKLSIIDSRHEYRLSNLKEKKRFAVKRICRARAMGLGLNGMTLKIPIEMWLGIGTCRIPIWLLMTRAKVFIIYQHYLLNIAKEHVLSWSNPLNNIYYSPSAASCNLVTKLQFCLFLHSDVTKLQNVTKQNSFIGQIAAASFNLATLTTNFHSI